MIGRRAFLGAASLGLLGVCPAGAFAQGPEPKKRTALKPVPPALPSAVQADEQVNRLLAPVLDKHHLPGLIGALVVGEKLVAIGAVGVRRMGSDEPIKVGDRVHIGSCTKAMTATLVGMLVDQGKLAWSSTIREIFPERARTLHADFQAVTLSELLTHRAGLPHDGPWWELGRGRSTTDQRRELLARILRNPPESQPGTTYFYSNVGYAIAGLMAEQVTGKPWEMLMRERLFGPLAMSTAGFGPPGLNGGKSEPWGHREVAGQFAPVREDNAPSMGPAGTVHVSVPDWAKFAVLHLRANQGKARLLEPETFRTLHTPPIGQEYAGGWFVTDRSWAGGRVLTHKGSNMSWFASIWLAPVRDFALLIATNQGGELGSAAEKACDDAVAALLELHALPPVRPAASARRKRTGRR